jgi:hypothetical protein
VAFSFVQNLESIHLRDDVVLFGRHRVARFASQRVQVEHVTDGGTMRCGEEPTAPQAKYHESVEPFVQFEESKLLHANYSRSQNTGEEDTSV